MQGRRRTRGRGARGAGSGLLYFRSPAAPRSPLPSPAMRFDDRTIVLTGVGREGQVGEAVAHAFGDAGARVVAIDRDPAQVEARAAALRARGAEARAFACDLTDDAQLAAVAGEIAAAY